VAVTLATAVPAPVHAASAPPHPWTELDTKGKFAPQVGRNPDGRPEVFALVRNPNRVIHLYHQWQTTWGGWSGWSNLAGDVASFTATNDADGRLRVVAIWNDGTLRTVAQGCPNCGWGSWSAPIATGLWGVFAPAAAVDTNGLLRIYVEKFGDIHSIYEVIQTSGGGWGPLVALAGLPERSIGAAVQAAHNADGRIELFFVLGPTYGEGHIYHMWQLGGGGWSGWYSLGGDKILQESWDAGNVVNEADGTLAVYTVNLDKRRVNRIAQNCPNCGWGGWTTVGDQLGANLVVHSLRVGANADGRLELFARATNWDVGQFDDGRVELHHMHESVQGGGWTGWSDFGQLVAGPTTPQNDGPGVYPSVKIGMVRDGGGRLWAFEGGSDDNVWHLQQDAADGTWN
jgi:ribosomal protein S27AE